MDTLPKKDYGDFQIGMKVCILEGPFKEFRGVIKEVDQAKRGVKVAVNFFERERIVEFRFTQLREE
jgi:transcription termination/antitermination protein NusG